MGFRGPLAGRYTAAAILVVFALIPYLALSAAMFPLLPVLSKGLGLSQESLELTMGMANAAYAIGTVLAVQFAQHLRQRRMLLVYVTGFLIASVLGAWAPTPAFFIVGHVLQGLCTSLMLIAAVPPLVTGFPAARMPWTGAIMNLCIFGAVAAGPTIGALQAAATHWRPLLWCVAGCALVAWVFTLLTWEDAPAQDTSAPWDWVALMLAGAGCAAAFFGASQLETHAFLSLIAFLPLVAGLILIIVLVVYQYRIRRPLMPLRQMATTKPVGGIIIALTAGAASVGAIDLMETALQSTASPSQAGVLFLPQVGGAMLTAILFGTIFRRRWMALLPFVGCLCLAAGIVLVTGVSTGSHVLVLIGSGLIGVGVGAAVSPALFVAGFSLASAQIQRVFALIELLRAVAAFLAAPLILHLAMTVNGGPRGAGINTAMWVCFAIAAGGGLVTLYLWILGRVRLEDPDLERWQRGEEAAWETPRLAAGIRRRERVADLPMWREQPVRR